MDPNDIITDELIKKVNDIYSNPSEIYYCNNAEMASVMRSMRNMNEMTVIVERYKEVQKNRILKELNKTKLNTDVNDMIVSML